MADSDAEKTEEATPKRLSEARDKGQVATSREITNLFALAGVTLLIVFLAPGMAGDLKRLLVVFFEQPHLITLEDGGVVRLLARITTGVAGVLFLPFLFLSLLAFAASYVQNGLLFSAEPLKPTLSKLSPIKGAKRIFSTQSLVEFGKSLAKFAIIGTLVFWIIVPEIRGIEALVSLPTSALPEMIHDIVLLLVGAVTAVMAAVAAADWSYQRYKHRKGLRMTKQEVKDEHKSAEGDPEVKGKLRQLRRERSRRRMMAAVPDADVVITNPTHFAVALRYDPQAMAAPRVIAKGADALARKIREVATENDVPLVENPPLARALYASVEVDAEVPEAHYRAVAEVISYIWRIRGKTIPRASL
ncbi:MAG: flagellar biosynthesis protein FlhB [Alphaproteobacteria bacterium]